VAAVPVLLWGLTIPPTAVMRKPIVVNGTVACGIIIA
jgi:hypothetical protein